MEKYSSENGINDDNTNNDIGKFLNFVLLDEAEWDRKQLLEDLINDWNIGTSVATEIEEMHTDMIMIKVDNMILSITFADMPIPDGEAESFAAMNYLWDDAVAVTRMHKAQIIVAVLGEEPDLKKKAELLVKAVVSCLKQEHAIGVYGDGTVYEPEFYKKFSAMIQNGDLPIYNLVWFGLYRDDRQGGMYTDGMKKFGKKEFELIDTIENVDLDLFSNIVSSLVSYVLENDMTLQDGDSIGFSESLDLKIVYKDGIALDSKTLQIQLEFLK